MMRKLRRSFVRLTMISAALVLVILMGLVNLLNYVQRDGADRAILSVLAENGGKSPDAGKAIHYGARPGLSAESVYEARYFTVTLSGAGELVFADLSQTPWVDEAEAVAKARTLQAAGETAGVYESTKYLAVDRGGEVMYIFLAWSQNMEAMRSFFLNSLVVTGAGLLVLFFLAWALSGRAVRPIVESYEKQKSFITNAGHELKTPLAVIESSTDVLELESGENKWTRSIHGQVARLSSLTADLIALARMDEGTRKLELTELDISAVVSESLAPFALLAEQRGLPFTAEIAPDIRLRSHRESLEKLCGILADNAVKYTPEGGSIRFSLAREGSRVLLRAENPAEGLRPGKQEKLFDRFYRGDESRGSQPGYGLGLPLARSLAEALGGTLEAESPDGKRLLFTARLA